MLVSSNKQTILGPLLDKSWKIQNESMLSKPGEPPERLPAASQPVGAKEEYLARL